MSIDGGVVADSDGCWLGLNVAGVYDMIFVQDSAYSRYSSVNTHPAVATHQMADGKYYCIITREPFLVDEKWCLYSEFETGTIIHALAGCLSRG